MKKEKIYLLPGLMNNELLWERINPILEDKYELIYLPIPLTKDFDDAVKYLDNLIKDEKINLLGFSLGAYLASYYTIKRSEKINRVFLVAGTPSSLSEIEIKKREIFLKQMDNFGSINLSTKKIKLLLEDENQEDKYLIKLIKNMFDSFSLEEYKLQLSTTFQRKDIYEELLLINIPINFIYSKKDRLLNLKSMEKIDNRFKNVVLKPLEGSSHMIPLEKAETLSKEIICWMNRKT
ncbi:alpha/beta fold hydrolase [Halarcobacter sp.]|uniref:alpha/beta fold hydrolase n=1 Tax=Halarcobacter sp. TaxID=2321133 RepID=UPI002AAB321B|nr:alpha/beta fold hydrolase [Halarcobacter sp.]